MADQLKEFIFRIFYLEGAWIRDHAWINETLAGIIGGLVTIVIGHYAISPLDLSNKLQIGFIALLYFFSLSMSYEIWIDPNGFTLKDVGMRIPGFLLVFLFYLIL